MYYCGPPAAAAAAELPVPTRCGGCSESSQYCGLHASTATSSMVGLLQLLPFSCTRQSTTDSEFHHLGLPLVYYHSLSEILRSEKMDCLDWTGKQSIDALSTNHVARLLMNNE